MIAFRGWCVDLSSPVPQFTSMQNSFMHPFLLHAFLPSKFPVQMPVATCAQLVHVASRCWQIISTHPTSCGSIGYTLPTGPSPEPLPVCRQYRLLPDSLVTRKREPGRLIASKPLEYVHPRCVKPAGPSVASNYRNRRRNFSGTVRLLRAISMYWMQTDAARKRKL